MKKRLNTPCALPASSRQRLRTWINVKTYILRIYRYKKGKPHNLVGLVEEVGQKGKKAFTNLNELWDILSSSREMRNKERGKIFHRS